SRLGVQAVPHTADLAVAVHPHAELVGAVRRRAYRSLHMPLTNGDQSWPGLGMISTVSLGTRQARPIGASTANSPDSATRSAPQPSGNPSQRRDRPRAATDRPDL